MTPRERDDVLGAALRALPVPAYEPQFKAELRERLDAEAPRGVAPSRRRRRGGARVTRPRLPRPVAAGLALALVLLAVVLTQDTSKLPGGGGLGVTPATAAELGKRVERAIAGARTLAGTLIMRQHYATSDESVTTRTRFLLTAAGDQRLQTPGQGDSAYRVATATESTLEDPKVGGRFIVRTGMASGPPDGGPVDAVLGRSFAAVVHALRGSGDDRIQTTTYDGRPAWRLRTRALVGVNAAPGDSGDVLDITIDQATGFPLRVLETFKGRLVRDQRIERLRVDAPAPAARFSLRAPREPGPPTRFDEGYRRVTPARARTIAGYRPLVPTALPAGYRQAETSAIPSRVRRTEDEERGARTGNEGANPLSLGVVATAYRRGFEVVLVTTRRRSGIARCTPRGDPSAECWADPLGAGEGFFVRERPLAITTGALAGARARLVIDPRAVPHVWALTRDLVVTVSGSLSAEELVKVVRSLAR